MREQFIFEAEPFEIDSEFDEYEEEQVDSFSEFDSEEEFDTELADSEWEGERGWRFPVRRTSFRPRSGLRPRPSGRLPKPPRRPIPPKYPRPPGRRRYGPITVFPEPPVVEPEPQGTEQVRWVQSSLNRILGLRLPVDGVMTPETRSAIRSFQERRGLPVDGIVGPDTERAIMAARAGNTTATGDKQPAAPGDSQPPGPEDTQPTAPGEFDEFDTEFADFEWEEEINRRSREYIRWVQGSLNKIMGLRLAVDGIIGSQTRSAIRSFQEKHGLAIDGIVGSQTERALIVAGAGNPPGSGVPSYVPTMPLQTPSSIQGLSSNIVKLAKQEWERWGKGTIKESDGRVQKTLQDYWETGTGNPYPGPHTAWSAAFISWVMKKAGAGSSFKYSSAHTVYVGEAKRNKLANNSNPFKAYRITEITPRLGDLVCVERQDDKGNWSGVNYDNVDQGFRATHCDIVTEVLPGRLKIIGGNVSNSVSEKTIRTDANGRVIEPRYYAVVRVSNSGVSMGTPDIMNVQGIRVARQIAAQVEALLAAAEAGGIRLGGGGYRSPEAQIELRKKHCGTTHYDIYQKPASQCIPPTAPPGKSMHEKGLAIDFTYNRQTIKSRTNPGFQWLSQNAARFGLYNLPSEPWHWSINGR